MVQTKKVTFRGLPKEVRMALLLLRRNPKVRKRALGSPICEQSEFDCPVARGYHICASPDLFFIADQQSSSSPDYDKWAIRYSKILIKNGWSEKIYREFIKWYDAIDVSYNMSYNTMYARQGFVKKFLSTPK